jgi:hypothetical protein
MLLCVPEKMYSAPSDYSKMRPFAIFFSNLLNVCKQYIRTTLSGAWKNVRLGDCRSTKWLLAHLHIVNVVTAAHKMAKYERMLDYEWFTGEIWENFGLWMFHWWNLRECWTVDRSLVKFERMLDYEGFTISGEVNSYRWKVASLPLNPSDMPGRPFTVDVI